MKKVYYNGQVYTGELPLQQAFVEENGKFTYVGTSEAACEMAESEDELIDLKGQFVCAGFNDSHMHVLGFGSALQKARLDEHTTSLGEMLEYLKTFAQNHKEGWIVGRGWNQDYFTDVNRMPNRYDLDQVSKEQPISIVRACGHCMIVNSKALEIMGITAGTPQPEGGQIEMENGEPSGRLFENALNPVYDTIPAPDKEAVKSMICSAASALNSYGITSCQTDDYSMSPNLSWKVINEAYKELEEAGELTVRIYEQSNLTNLTDLKEFVEAGNVTGVGSEYFKIGPLKMLGDGALGARTAFLTIPYADKPETKGIPVFTQETFDEMIEYANDHDMQVAIHTIGDACLDMVLSAIEKALDKKQKDDHRHGIVHCQITRPDQLEKIADMRLHVYAQSIFLDYDIHIVEERVGKEMAATSYSWKTLMDKGVSVSNGSDCPVELPFALGGIQCAVTRRSLKESKTYLPDQAFSVKEAIDSYTIRRDRKSVV